MTPTNWSIKTSLNQKVRIIVVLVVRVQYIDRRKGQASSNRCLDTYDDVIIRSEMNRISKQQLNDSSYAE